MSESKPETVFITKYALTDGIQEREVISMDPDGWVVVKWPGQLNGQQGVGKSAYAITREAALARAEEMRLAKIASHQRSIEKLRGLSFDPVSPTPAGAISGAQEG